MIDPELIIKILDILFEDSRYRKAYWNGILHASRDLFTSAFLRQVALNKLDKEDFDHALQVIEDFDFGMPIHKQEELFQQELDIDVDKLFDDYIERLSKMEIDIVKVLVKDMPADKKREIRDYIDERTRLLDEAEQVEMGLLKRFLALVE